MNNQDNPENLQDVTIFKPHTHGGKRLVPGPEGIKLSVNEHDAKFLKDAGVLDRPQSEPAPSPTTVASLDSEPPAGPAAAVVAPGRPQISTRPQG